MSTRELINELNDLNILLEAVMDGTGHVGIALQIAALIKDHTHHNDPDAENNLYSNPFYNFFQNAANDVHTQYPIKKLALRSAIEGYVRYLSN
ncbi:MAG: hypothetical protein MRY83_08200 [Flavobacteriales bacterium]|nr:hypothetical protein [Flavobacteriales bacterium]